MVLEGRQWSLASVISAWCIDIEVSVCTLPCRIKEGWPAHHWVPFLLFLLWHSHVSTPPYLFTHHLGNVEATPPMLSKEKFL